MDIMEDDKEAYNLPIASFTFGKNGQKLQNYPIPNIKDISKDNNKNTIIKESTKNNNLIEPRESNDSYNLSNDDSSRRFSFKNIINKNNKKKISNKNLNNANNNKIIFIDKEDNNSSYIKIILYALSYMPLISNYIINDFKFNIGTNINEISNQILLIIHDILIKIERIKNMNQNNNINNIINIEQLKDGLYGLFKNRNKFLKNSLDDPMDFLYIIIKLLHDFNKNNLNDKTCNECFSHKNISFNLYKIYECECKAKSNPILGINNYFLDIPLNIIINRLTKIKIKDMNQMLFDYYKKLIYNIKIKGDCPRYGKKCELNKVHKKYILKTCPSYLIFNLENDIFKNNELFFSLNNVLKTFILIPHIFDIKSLFNINNKNDKSNYELIGILFLKISKVYSCIFKEKDIFYYYEDNIFIKFYNYFDIILFSLKNGNIPISIIYQKDIEQNNINNNINYELNSEQINKLEKYVKNANNLNQNLKNKIRTKENILSDNIIINYGYSKSNNPSYSENNTLLRYSNSNNSYQISQKSEYICNHCERINKTENQNCLFCGFNNKNCSNNINKNKQIQNILRLKNNKIIKKKLVLEKDKISKTQNNKYLTEINAEYKNINPYVQKYFDINRPCVLSAKDINKNNFITKQKLSSYLINHNKLQINNNINSFSHNVEKKKTKTSLEKSPKLINKFYFNKLENESSKAKNKSNKNHFISFTTRNSKKYDLNSMNNEDFYSEKIDKCNNQLNINLKINNNNNYNIFEFGGKKKIIHLSDYNKYKTEDNYYQNHNNKKIIKKIHSIKTRNTKKINQNKIINYNLPNNVWVCTNCLKDNEISMKNCIYCNKERIIKSINTSPINRSNILNENRINFNNVLFGQMSTKNKNIINKI